MRIFEAGLSLLLIATLVGCTLHATKRAALPPPPNPVAAQPPPPQPPLSAPQTAVVLPGVQLVNPGAIPKPPAAPAQVAEKIETPAQQAQTHPRKSGASATINQANQAPAPAKSESEPEQEPPPAPVVDDQHSPFKPILSADEQKRIEGQIDSRRRQIDDLISKAQKHHSNQNQSLFERIDSFMKQSDEARNRGDFTQADELSKRAQVLAGELQVE